MSGGVYFIRDPASFGEVRSDCPKLLWATPLGYLDK